MNGRLRKQALPLSRERIAPRFATFAERILRRFGAENSALPIRFFFRRTAQPATNPVHRHRNSILTRSILNRILILPRFEFRTTTSQKQAIRVTNRFRATESDHYSILQTIRPVVRVFQSHSQHAPTQPATSQSAGHEQASEAVAARNEAPLRRVVEDAGQLQQLTDRVIQSIDNRIIAQRERLGVD